MRFTDLNLKIIRPCEDNPGLFIAEINLNSDLDLDKIYNSLKKIADFKHMTYSKLLNLIYLVEKEKTIHFYKNGKISITKVKNEEDAKKTFILINEYYNFGIF